MMQKIKHEPSIQHDAQRMAGIVRTQQAIAQAGLDLQEVMDIVVANVQQLTPATAAVVELAEGDEMVYHAASGTAANSVGVRLRIDASLSGACVLSGQILSCEDSENDDRVDRAACRRVGARSMLVVPLFHDGRSVGVLKVLSPEPNVFAEQDVHTLQLMAGLIGSTMGRAAEFEAKQALLEERTQMMEALQDSEARFMAFMDHSPAVAYMKDEQGRFVYVNLTLRERFKDRITDWRGKTSFDIWPPEVARQLHENDIAVLRNEWAVESEEMSLFADGPHYWLTHKFPFQDAAGRRFLAGIAIDITDRKRAESQLEEMNEVLRSQSVRDSLTGLFNRRYMEESLEREISRAQRNGQQVALILFDIDHFKRINDTYGHVAGDEVLRCLGQLLLEQTRKLDVACRYGGEEFLLIMPGVSKDAAQSKAEGLRAFVEQHAELRSKIGQPTDLSPVQSVKPITLSLGVALFPEHGTTGSAVLQSADAALYRAKQAGRNRVVVA